jgi:hypothetical protein
MLLAEQESTKKAPQRECPMFSEKCVAREAPEGEKEGS